MLTRRRGRALYRLAAEVVERGVPGALVDCGVWNGGSTALLSAGAPGRQVWAFDSFAGLPQPGPKDEESETAGRAGDLSTSEQRLREAFARFGHPERLRVRKGWFEETFPRAREEVGPVALVHCDGDWYDSIRLTLETFYPKLSPGGFVVVDDYGHFAGARRATDDFRSERRISAPLVAVDGPAVYWRK